MVKMELPQVAVVSTQDGNVVEEFRRPVQYSYFDLLGRMVASKNDNERVTRAVYNAAGEVIEAVDAAGNASASVYDAFGNLVFRPMSSGTAPGTPTTPWGDCSPSKRKFSTAGWAAEIPRKPSR